MAKYRGGPPPSCDVAVRMMRRCHPQIVRSRMHHRPRTLLILLRGGKEHQLRRHLGQVPHADNSGQGGFLHMVPNLPVPGVVRGLDPRGQVGQGASPDRAGSELVLRRDVHGRDRAESDLRARRHTAERRPHGLRIAPVVGHCLPAVHARDEGGGGDNRERERLLDVAIPVRIAPGVDLARVLRERERGPGELGIRRGGSAARGRGRVHGHPFGDVDPVSHMHGEADSRDTPGRGVGAGE